MKRKTCVIAHFAFNKILCSLEYSTPALVNMLENIFCLALKMLEILDHKINLLMCGWNIRAVLIVEINISIYTPKWDSSHHLGHHNARNILFLLVLLFYLNRFIHYQKYFPDKSCLALPRVKHLKSKTLVQVFLVAEHLTQIFKLIDKSNPTFILLKSSQCIEIITQNDQFRLFSFLLLSRNFNVTVLLLSIISVKRISRKVHTWSSYPHLFLYQDGISA